MKRYVALLVGFVAALAMAAPASASLSDVPTPTVTGPVPVTADSTPWAATDQPLGDYGYVEEEFKYSGNAFSYDTTGAIDQTGTKITTGGPANDGAYPFKTRMIVRRPTDPADFNGTVVVEWLNVTATFDLEANWYGDPQYLLDNGYAYVGISAQRDRRQLAARTGTPAATATSTSAPATAAASRRSPTTPSPTTSTPPGSRRCSTAAPAPTRSGPLAKPDTVLASGQSQSGSRLSTYYNKVQPIHDVVDAFLITVSSSQLRDDGNAPAIRVLSETENRIPRTEPDTANYRQWEVAGGSHFPRMAFDNLQKPIERDLGIDPLGDLHRVPALAGAMAVRRQLGLRAPRRLGERRARTADALRAVSTSPRLRTPTTSSSATTSASPRAGSGCPRSRSRRD